VRITHHKVVGLLYSATASLFLLAGFVLIHSFGVPAMRVKQDAIPGMMFPVWFTPTVRGDFDIACSQLCRLGHYRMRGVVKVMTSDEFQAWLATP
jgi:cytochrome c oxidase subunit 2